MVTTRSRPFVRKRSGLVWLSIVLAFLVPLRAWSRPDKSPTPSTAEIDQLIEQLSSRSFQVREQASRRLAHIGAAAYPRLRQILHTHPDAEVRRRAARLLDIPAMERAAASQLAQRLMPLVDEFCAVDIYEIDRGSLIARGIRGLYEHLHEPVPSSLTVRLRQARSMKPDACERLLSDACLVLVQRGHWQTQLMSEEFVRATFIPLDPYSTLIADPVRACGFPASMVGVGVELKNDPGRRTVRVVTPLAGGPACQGGIRAGDRIIQIGVCYDDNGTALARPRLVQTAGRTVADVQGLLLGKAGSHVTLGIGEADTGRVRLVDLIRRRVDEETVLGWQRQLDGSWQYWIDPEQRIAYVRLARFGRDTIADLTRVIEQLKPGGVRGLVLDLRFCPGGLLMSGVKIANCFLPAGRIVTIQPRADKAFRYDAEADDFWLAVPMVCLVNRETASSAEFVAACLQDHGRAVISGERTQGRGYVQNIVPILEGHELELTTAIFLRPSGKKLDKMRLPGRDPDEWGVQPDGGFAFPLRSAEYNRLRQHLEHKRLIFRRPIEVQFKPREVPDRALTAAVRKLKTDLALRYFLPGGAPVRIRPKPNPPSAEQLAKLRQAVAACEKDVQRILARPGALCDPASALEMAQLALAEAKADLAAAQKNTAAWRAQLRTVIRLREKRLLDSQDLLRKGAVDPADVEEEAERLSEVRSRLEHISGAD
jgi:carboxyl-terminal processing protease